ncbi:MAG TPA: sugar ABC transporter permease [Thermotogota bacterium]|nr:sugar ABC transporter permease [Thermotogota bacterium]HRW34039.1 sugar ABC transporter permease [Thermotogota bacterium]
MKKIIPYLLLVPTFFVIIAFIYAPAVNSFKMSFFRENKFGTKTLYVGLDNFEKVLFDPEYLQIAGFTLLYVGLTVFLTVFLSFLLALLLNKNVPGTYIYRALIFIPYAVSPAIAGSLWTFLLDPVAGHVNYLFTNLFGIQIAWLTTRPYAFYALLLATIWKMMPFNLIFYIAGLQSISSDLLESATLDGASAFVKTWKIKFPLVSPMTFYLVIMNIISGMFQSFAIINVMTSGGPGGYTNTMMYKVYLDAFSYQKTGLASAQSVVMFIIMAIVTVIYFIFGERRVHYR